STQVFFFHPNLFSNESREPPQAESSVQGDHQNEDIFYQHPFSRLFADPFEDPLASSFAREPKPQKEPLDPKAPKAPKESESESESEEPNDSKDPNDTKDHKDTTQQQHAKSTQVPFDQHPFKDNITYHYPNVPRKTNKVKKTTNLLFPLFSPLVSLLNN